MPRRWSDVVCRQEKQACKDAWAAGTVAALQRMGGAHSAVICTWPSQLKAQRRSHSIAAWRTMVLAVAWAPYLDARA